MNRSFLIIFMTFIYPTIVFSAEDLPKQLEGVTIAEHLGSSLNLDLEFTNHEGNTVPLKTYFQDDRPVLLTLNYYECPMLCTLQLNALIKGLKDLPWAPGKNFRMVTLSIDPDEKSPLANQKRTSHINALGKGDVDWNFLVGQEKNIKNIADSLGFSYSYDAEQDQFAHPAAIFFISSKGKVMRYLYGIDYPSQDLKFALLETSSGTMGSPIDKLILSCFHYDATLGRYGPFAFGMMRVGGVLTLIILGGWLLFLWRKDSIFPKRDGGHLS
jgi:protein SCO1